MPPAVPALQLVPRATGAATDDDVEVPDYRSPPPKRIVHRQVRYVVAGRGQPLPYSLPESIQ